MSTNTSKIRIGKISSMAYLLGAMSLSLVCPSGIDAQAVPSPTSDSSPEQKTLLATRVQGNPLRLDGRLDEDQWQAATPATGFTQVQPEDGVPPSEVTQVRVLYDADALYIGARMFDQDAGSVTGRLARRDVYPSSDQIEVSIDSYHDHRTSFVFSVNPAGVRGDGITANDDFTPDTSWDPIWEVATQVDSLGWTAEFRIPFSQLRFSTDSEQEWGINFTREIFRRTEFSRWNWARNTAQGYASLFGHLEGLREIPQPKRAELLPFSLAKADFDAGANPADPFNDGSTQDLGVGLDLKYGLTSNLTLSATINPDFGQVEVDPSVVNLTAFETFYEDRRPFFVEGANIFQFGSGSGGFVFGAPQLFYSRRIGRSPSRPAYEPGGFVDNPGSVRILGAGKLSGQVRGWSVGILNATTDRETARIQSPAGGRSRRPVEPLSNYGVFSLRKDLGEGRGGMGIVATNVVRDLSSPVFLGIPENAQTAGVDFFLRFWGNQWAASGTLSGSMVRGDPAAMLALQTSSARYFQRPDQDYVSVDSTARTMGGYATSLQIGKVAGNWTFGSDFFLNSPGFEINDAGFGTRSDRIFHGLRLSRRWLDPTPLFMSRQMALTWSQTWNLGAVRQSRSFSAQAFGRFRNNWSGLLAAQVAAEGFNDKLTRGGPLMIFPANRLLMANLSSDSRKMVQGQLSLQTSWSTEGGRMARVSPSLTLRPSGAIDLTTSVSYQDIHSSSFYVTGFDDPFAEATMGRRTVFGELDQRTFDATLRADVTLTPSLTIQWYAQPFITTGEYGGFMELAAPKSYDFLRYGEDGGSTISYDQEKLAYQVDPDGGGPTPAFGFRKPDFRVRSLNSNLVLRWEYSGGSTLYLVWNHGRSGFSRDPNLDLFGEIGRIMDDTLRNTLMVKVNYWLSL